MELKQIRLGGVPEHFNLPVHLAREQKAFESRGVEIQWTDFPGGTGQMCRALREGSVDLCILLTEGIIRDIVHGNPSKIISEYVKTPLNWGIHTGVQNSLHYHPDIYDKKYAISRFGSGSHLMAIVDANSRGKKIADDQFKVIGNLDGALQSLTALETDVFYWEKYTTKPYVDAGQLKRVGEFNSPWPCFVIAASNDIIKREPDSVIRTLRTIHDSCDAFMQNDQAIEWVSRRYEQKMADTERWFHSTEWAIHGWVRNKMIKGVIYHLQTAGILEKDQEIPELIWKR